MKKTKRIKMSALVVSSSILGAFTSRYVDTIMDDFPFPWDLITILLVALFFFSIVYFIWGDWFEDD